MVKFSPLLLKSNFKEMASYPKRSAKVNFNAVHVPFLASLSHRSNKNSIFLAKKQKNARNAYLLADSFGENRYNFQPSYTAQRLLSGVKHELENRKIFQVLYSFADKNLLLGDSKALKSQTSKNISLNLLAPINFSLIMTFCLNQLAANKTLVANSPKALVGLADALKIESLYGSGSLEVFDSWNLKRLFRKIQRLNSLSGTSGFFSSKLIENWYLNKTSNKNFVLLSDLQVLYHVRRVKDEIEFIPNLPEKEMLTAYLQTVVKFFSLKASNQRLISLKNILRKTKRRRRARWSIFSRKYVKIKRYSIVPTSRADLNSVKFNKLFFNNVEN